MNKVVLMVWAAAATVAGELPAELKLGLGEKEVTARGARMNDPNGPEGWRLACVEIDKGPTFVLTLDLRDNVLSAKCESRTSTRKTYLAGREQ